MNDKILQLEAKNAKLEAKIMQLEAAQECTTGGPKNASLDDKIAQLEVKNALSEREIESIRGGRLSPSRLCDMS